MENMTRITCEGCGEVFEGPKDETMLEFEEHDCSECLAADELAKEAILKRNKRKRYRKA